MVFWLKFIPVQMNTFHQKVKNVDYHLQRRMKYTHLSLKCLIAIRMVKTPYVWTYVYMQGLTQRDLLRCGTYYPLHITMTS